MSFHDSFKYNNGSVLIVFAKIEKPENPVSLTFIKSYFINIYIESKRINTKLHWVAISSKLNSTLSYKLQQLRPDRQHFYFFIWNQIRLYQWFSTGGDVVFTNLHFSVN